MARDEVAVITGATSGIGLGLAEAFAAAGYRLTINGFAAPGEAEELVERLHRCYSTQVFYHPADLADPSQCEALIRDTESRFGSIRVLINNAGIQHVAPLESFPLERWDKILAVNLSAGFHTMRAALPGMQRRGAGRIINIASVHGLVASVHKAAYVAAKHGLVGLTRVAALENATRGITCNAICPGFVLTPLVQQQIDARAAPMGATAQDAAQDFLNEKQPTARFTTVEAIAALALFLCSPAAENITGACLPIDGGWTAQ
ncbi:MAG TPA: 3-hydroxybutyrate dehydrogenase [Acidobacteriaceae bacterium]|jgi:3-hydroxybutyrate dehydrogenase|nr:3-hydroxybutyrate dehydrogenase [Acidobacteriaceae bacterium]